MSGKLADSYYESTCKSLPPLPEYVKPDKFRRLWGEDELLSQKLEIKKTGYSKYPFNFDCCIPSADVCEKIPRGRENSLTEDDMKFPMPPSSGRRVPRRTPFQIFPVNNPDRTTPDGQMVLSEPTRRAMDGLFTRLYRTTSSRQIYTDKTSLMKMKMERDVQFAREPRLFPVTTCSRIINHTDPCPSCWMAHRGYNYETNKKSYINMDYLTTYNCFYCRSFETPVKKLTDGTQPCDTKETVEIEVVDTSNDIDPQSELAGNENNTTEKLNGFADGIAHEPADNDAETNPDTKMEELGPWIDIGRTEFCHPPENENPVLTPYMLKFKLPSAKGCCSYQNGDMLPVIQDHGAVRNCMNTDLGNSTESSMEPYGEKQDHTKDGNRPCSEVNSERLPKIKLLGNTWTNRDEINLRRPCVSKVIGMFDKSDAHRRFCLQHLDIVPDLGTLRRPHRRVMFYGYNSFVFR